MTKGLKEKAVATQVDKVLETHGVRVWRNNIGLARYNVKGKTWCVKYGVGGNGGSDLLGFMPITITPEMVGKRVAVFVAVETKREKGGKKTDAQQAFIDNIVAFGGLAGFASKWEDAIQIIKDFRERLSSKNGRSEP